jgi:hypothetical protein
MGTQQDQTSGIKLNPSMSRHPELVSGSISRHSPERLAESGLAARALSPQRFGLCCTTDAETSSA